MIWPFNKNEEEQKQETSGSQEDTGYPDFAKPKQEHNYLAHLRLIEQANNNILAGGITQDGDEESRLKMSLRVSDVVSGSVVDWFSSQSFIGFPLCAILSQQWLINKACFVPARDATRNGYDIVSMNGDEIPDETVKILQRYDKKFRIKKNCEELVGLGRIFGVRIALFEIESDDPEFYEKPFNLDGVAKGSYKGISQIDPNWCMPYFASGELNNPASRNFYDPTYWVINGKKYHRSHLHIFRNGQLPDLLKPVYMYGGYPVPQLIMSRVYSAERTTDESLNLVTSKRTSVWLTNLAMFMADEVKASERLMTWIKYRDNNGIKLGDKEGDQFQQFDTTLSGLDDVIMTNYQAVSGASNVPVTKLLGTAPKGFTTGENEDKNYNQELESIQEHDLTELVERHHQLVMKSCGLEVLDLTVNWRPTDSPTAKELAEINKTKADTYSSLVMSGVVDSSEVRTVLVKNPDSGFNDIGNIDSDDNPLDLSDEEIQAMKELGVSFNENNSESQETD